ncbi:MAG: zinc ribbon domain-containing protein [Chloroflexota bacterium]
MPVYEYLCPNCEAKFERLRPMSNGHQARCPDCGTQAPRVLSMFATFARGAGGEMSPVAGGGYACAAGGSCAGAGE